MLSNVVDKRDFQLEKPSNLPTPSGTSMMQRYVILTRIGSGGMGDVFLGIQRGAVDFQRLIVLKQIHAHLFEQAVQKQMFVDEASLIASLDHPHIVKVIDFRETDTSFFIVMEYVDGETLKFIRSACKKKKILFPFPLAGKLILEACDALLYAHNATSRQGKPLNIIHRDIGLHNLMIDRNGYLKVIDFGIAKSDIQTDKTSPGFLKGNPGYMSPDLFRYPKIDHRVDIYGLGLCLFELLTLERAYSFERNVDLARIIHHVTTTDLPLPSSIVPTLPRELDDIVAKATAKNRDQRYQTAAEFAADLKWVSTKYAHEFEGLDIKEWFNANFSDQISQRIRFEQEVIDSANNAAEGKSVSINSYAPPPNNPFESGSGIGFITPKSGAVHSKKRLGLILGGIALFAVLAMIPVYFLGIRPSSSAGETVGSNEASNLMIKSTPSGASVFVDGKSVGITIDEGTFFSITSGIKHQIDIRKDGYVDYSTTVLLSDNSRQNIDIVLSRDGAVTGKNDSSPATAMENATGEMVIEDVSPSSKTGNRKRGIVSAKAKTPKASESAPFADPVESNAEVPLLDNPPKGTVPLLDDSEKSKNAVPLI